MNAHAHGARRASPRTNERSAASARSDRSATIGRAESAIHPRKRATRIRKSVTNAAVSDGSPVNGVYVYDGRDTSANRLNEAAITVVTALVAIHDPSARLVHDERGHRDAEQHEKGGGQLLQFQLEYGGHGGKGAAAAAAAGRSSQRSANSKARRAGPSTSGG